MKSKRSKKAVTPKKRARIKTSIMELVQELANLTNDDNLVVSTMQSIFGSYNVRLAGAPVAVRLVGSLHSPRVYKKRNGGGIGLRFA